MSELKFHNFKLRNHCPSHEFNVKAPPFKSNTIKSLPLGCKKSLFLRIIIMYFEMLETYNQKERGKVSKKLNMEQSETTESSFR